MTRAALLNGLPYALQMKKIAIVVSLSLLSLLLFAVSAKAELVEGAAKVCHFCEAWNKPQMPFRVFGDTWSVGTQGLASILVVTDAGLILIDGA